MISRTTPYRSGFTLLEVILVLVLILIVSGISIPYFAGSSRSTKLKTAARTIERVSRYGRSMSILREETLTMVLNHETMELYLGTASSSTTNAADGELDQEVLKRLGYVDGQEPGIEKEVRKQLPEGLGVRNFEKDWTEEDDRFEDVYRVSFYPNGLCEWFELELEDNRGNGIRIENDPVSGRVWSEFMQ